MKNLDLFRLTKSQMNVVCGGQVYDCHVSDVDVGGSISLDIEVESSSEEKAEKSLRNKYPRCYVSCY